MNKPNSPIGSLRILVVDDHARARESIADILMSSGHAVECRASAIEALRDLEVAEFDVVLTDLKMPGMNGLEFIRAVHEHDYETQIVMVTAHASVSSAVEAMRYGAFDYIEKPFTADQLDELVSRAVRHGKLVGKRSSIPDPAQDASMIGSSSAMRSLRNKIAQIAPTNETVLITGESGVGKELVARAIHAASSRSQHALVSVNCPALSSQLMESELFGHERGSFTSADAPRIGRFELADQGTLLLDEVTEISLPLQAKLLRVLQEKVYERVGSSITQPADARVLASSNRELQDEVTSGNFRQDLYFRLAVVPLTVPALREREEDIPVLIQHFQEQAETRVDRSPCDFTGNALALLCEYRWPGNVRELENLVTRACVLFSGSSVTADDLRPWLLSEEGEQDKSEDSHEWKTGMNLQEMERQLIESTLERCHGHRANTARALGIGVRTLTNKLRAYGYAPREKSFTRVA